MHILLLPVGSLGAAILSRAYQPMTACRSDIQYGGAQALDMRSLKARAHPHSEKKMAIPTLWTGSHIIHTPNYWSAHARYMQMRVGLVVT